MVSLLRYNCCLIVALQAKNLYSLAVQGNKYNNRNTNMQPCEMIR